MGLPNLVLPSSWGEYVGFTPHNGGRAKDVRSARDRDLHAKALSTSLEAAFEEAARRQEAVPSSIGGSYIEFCGANNVDLAAQSLEDARSGIRLLNVREDGVADFATVFVPSGAEKCYRRKIAEYADHGKDGKKGPRNSKLLDNVESIGAATVKSFWTGDPCRFPTAAAAWVEVWLSAYDGEDPATVADDFASLLETERVEHRDKALAFPERAVVLVRACLGQLEKLVDSTNHIAELREAAVATSFFDSMQGAEQREWVDELLARTVFEPGPATVCILDTGISSGHPLLAPTVQASGLLTANDSWSLADSSNHGTKVAGIAAYGNLKESLASSDEVVVTHRIESVKILDEHNPTKPELYGSVAQEAIARIQIARDEKNRVFCSAVTANDREITSGLPTSWSAAVDDVIARPEEHGGELFLVSAGNVAENDIRSIGFHDANHVRGVRSPGQAWNALTVGGYVENAVLSEEYGAATYGPLAALGDLSPYSSTSVAWSPRTPVKPEILCPAGNVVQDAAGVMAHPDLALLSTGADFTSLPLEHFYGTSAAVSYAAWMAAEIENAYPELWPETVRALMVHSARWTDAMRDRFCKPGSREDSVTKGRRVLLRSCGYGIPSLDRAVESASNRVNLVIEDELQPFCNKVAANGSSSDATKDMKFYELPWPKELLQSLGDRVDATLRVTLSYYIEPSPGRVGWKDKYVYQSFGLKFDVNKPGETKEEFLCRVNAGACDDGDTSRYSTSKGWYLGPDNRDVGSIHSDCKPSTALELSDIDFIAVFPVNGWWRKRKHLGRIDSKARFSLVVSIETPDTSTDLYTEIVNKIDIRSAIPVEIWREPKVSWKDANQ